MKGLDLMQSLGGVADHSNLATRPDRTSPFNRIMMTQAAPTPDVIYRTCDRLIAVAWDELSDETSAFLMGELERLEVDLDLHPALKIAADICDVIEEEDRSELTAAQLKEARCLLFPGEENPLPSQKPETRPALPAQWSTTHLPFPEFSAA